jgi:hypothetical protein
MKPINRAAVAALAALLAISACTGPPAGGTQNPGATATPGPAATTGAAPTSSPVAGDACSFLTAEEIEATIAMSPVEIAERPGRGDCDYWLTAAKDTKVNVGVTTGPDAAALFESTKGLGEPATVTLGDEAYSIFNESFGTVVVVRKGESVAVVQLFGGTDAEEQLTNAAALARVVIDKL